MGHIRITFYGICTFLDDFPLLVPPEYANVTPHRMVLVNASSSQMINEFYPGLGIEPHIATFAMPLLSELILSGTLPAGDGHEEYKADIQGCRMTVLNGVGPYMNRTGCLPHLASTMKDPNLFGFPGPTVYAGQPNTASCYFDISVGKITSWNLSATTVGGTEVGISRLEIETQGAPQLLIEPFLGSPFISVPVVVIMPENIEAFVDVANLPKTLGSPADAPNDYMLHYLTTAQPNVRPTVVEDVAIPATVHCPLFPFPIPRWIRERIIGITPGCSNSGYP